MIFVIGCNSFSGQDFVNYCLDQGQEVFGVSRTEKHPIFLPYLKNKNIKNFRFEKVDFNCDLEKLFNLFSEHKPRQILSFASQSEVKESWLKPQDWININGVVFSKIIKYLSHVDWLDRFTQISSPEVYGSCNNITEDQCANPSTPYALSKLISDNLIKVYRDTYNLPGQIIRSTNVYGGEGQQLHKLIPRSFINIKLNKKTTLYGGGIASKSWIHIRDVSKGEYKALLYGKNETYHLGSKKAVSNKEITKLVAGIMNVKHEDYYVDGATRPGEDLIYYINSEKARKELDWKNEITLEDGLNQVGSWVNDNWDIIKNLPHEYIHKA